MNARPLQDVRLNHDEGNREERPGRFLITRAPIGQYVKMFRQLKTPPGSVLAGRHNVGSGRSGPTAIRVTGYRGTNTANMNTITIVFVGINDHLHSKGSLSRLNESMGEVVDAIKEGSFTKVTPRVVFALFPGYACLPEGLKFVYATVTLLSEGKYDVIISAPNCMVKMEKLRLLRAELPAVWSDISNAMRRFKDHALHMLVLDEVLGLELSNFNRQLKLKPGIGDDH